MKPVPFSTVACRRMTRSTHLVGAACATLALLAPSGMH